jgi:succinyl-diaminopimelate desuccinylase
MKQILLDLLKFQTTSEHNSELHKAIDYVEALFNDYEVQTKRYVQNGKPSIVITSKFTKTPRIFLNGHLDVVEASTGQFEPIEKDGKVYARGTSDMKGPVAAMIQAFIELLESNPTNLDIGLMLTTDEEVGGANGVDYLLKEKEYRSEIAFIPDGGRGNWEICTNEKGVMWYDIEVFGKATHAARKWQGENANEKLVQLVTELRSEFVENFSEATLEDQWKPTLNLGLIKGGQSQNSTSEYAKANLDIRFTEKQTLGQMKSFLDQFTSKYEDVKGQMTVYGNPTNIDADNKYLMNWVNIFENKFSEKASYYKTHGGSDGRFFAEYNIPTLIVKSTASEMHIEDEWIDYEDLVRFKDMVKDWIKESSKF